MDEASAFARVLTKTSPLTAEDIADLRGLFEFYRSSGAASRIEEAGSRPSIFISAADAVNVLRRLGLPKARLERNGGVLVQDGSLPKLLLNEQEFLLTAARLWRSEERGLIPVGELELREIQYAELHAARLFRTMDPKRTGRVSAEMLKFGLHGFSCRDMDNSAAEALCDKWAIPSRVLDMDDSDERFLTMEEFMELAVPLILPTIPKKSTTFMTEE